MASSLNHLQMVVPLTVAMRPERRTCAPSSARLHRDRGSPSLGEAACDLVIGEARTPSPCPLTRNVPISLGADRADPSLHYLLLPSTSLASGADSWRMRAPV